MLRKIRIVLWSLAGLGILLILGLYINNNVLSSSSNTKLKNSSQASPYITKLPGVKAPNFILEDQSGKIISLSQFHGKVVVLAFVDSECTTVCPITTQSMLDALKMLGKYASKVQLIGIDANPTAITVSDVQHYTVVHGMQNKWYFLTGTLSELENVWKEYHIYVQVVNNLIDHTPALFIIGPNGDERYVFLTPMWYQAVPVQAKDIAKAVASLLPEHPKLKPLPPLSGPDIGSVSATVTLSSVTSDQKYAILGPGEQHLYFFWASWDPSITQDLQQLNAYEYYAQKHGLPKLIAIDVAPVEKPGFNLSGFVKNLKLIYPVVQDKNGSIADSYEVMDLPWFTVLSKSGNFVWAKDGWINVDSLISTLQDIKNGKAAPLFVLPSFTGANVYLSNFTSTGVPVVLYFWGSWCGPCISELPMIHTVHKMFPGVTILYIDEHDSKASAMAVIKHDHISPSNVLYDPQGKIGQLYNLFGTPTSIFINEQGVIETRITGQLSRSTFISLISRIASNQ